MNKLYFLFGLIFLAGCAQKYWTYDIYQKDNFQLIEGDTIAVFRTIFSDTDVSLEATKAFEAELRKDGRLHCLNSENVDRIMQENSNSLISDVWDEKFLSEIHDVLNVKYALRTEASVFENVDFLNQGVIQHYVKVSAVLYDLQKESAVWKCTVVDGYNIVENYKYHNNTSVALNFLLRKLYNEELVVAFKTVEQQKRERNSSDYENLYY